MRTAFSRFIAAFLLAATLAILSAPTASAQCPMCRMSAESNLENGGDEGRELFNTGILYMLAMPYFAGRRYRLSLVAQPPQRDGRSGGLKCRFASQTLTSYHIAVLCS